MVHYNDKFLRYLELEIRIVWDIQTRYCDAQCKCLLELRQEILNEQALASQKELLPDIIAFNDALYLALQKMFDKAHELYSRISAFQPDRELEAKCFLPQEYPSSAVEKLEMEKIIIITETKTAVICLFFK